MAQNDETTVEECVHDPDEAVPPMSAYELMRMDECAGCRDDALADAAQLVALVNKASAHIVANPDDPKIEDIKASVQRISLRAEQAYSNALYHAPTMGHA